MSRPPLRLWRLLPGLLFYNLIGRHILYWQMKRTGTLDTTLLGRPGWISLADIRTLLRS